MGASRVYLYAVPEAARLYLKLGYSIVRYYVRMRLPLLALPESPIGRLEPQVEEHGIGRLKA